MGIDDHGLFSIGLLCCPLDYILSPSLAHISFLGKSDGFGNTVFLGKTRSLYQRNISAHHR
jgi:hypothetical protein